MSTAFDHFRLKNEMLFMNYLANIIGVCVVIFITYRPISQQFANAFRLIGRMGWFFEPLFGASMFVFTEVLHDVSFRVAPIDKGDALSMMQDIRGHKILEGVRGLDPVDLEILGRSLVGLGRLGLEHADIQEIDVNPLIVQGSKPIGVDALVVLGDTQAL